MFGVQWHERSVNRRRVVFAIVIAGVLLMAGIRALAVLKSDTEKDSDEPKNETYASEMSILSESDRVRVPLHDWELRYRVPEQSEQNRIAKTVRIFGGIVPHHLVAQSFIAEMFQLLADREHIPKTVVILSPNHEEVGASFVQTASMVWDTPEGPVDTDVVKSEEIAESFKTSLHNESMRREHGVYNIVPFVKHFLPDAKVVPVTLRFATPADDQNLLAEILSKWLERNNDVVVVASIDFSHYLSSEEARKKDEETRAAIERYDFSEIASYRSDHVDTPAGLAVFLRTMRILGADHQTVLRYDNSGQTLNRPFAETTSHFLITFTQI